jgi:hypothetical protein
MKQRSLKVHTLYTVKQNMIMDDDLRSVHKRKVMVCFKKLCWYMPVDN